MATDTASKLDELLDSLAEYAGDSKDKKREVALKLLDNAATKEIAEVIYRKGLSKRKADDSGTVTELETQLKQAKDELAEKAQQIRELEAKEPNWDRRLKDEAAKWQKRVDDAEGKVLAERQQSLDDMVSMSRQKFQAALRLGQEGGVDEHYGALLPAYYADRFRKDPENRTVRVLEIGETDSYYDPAEGDPAEQLARDAIAKVPPKDRIMGAPEGGGGTGSGGAPVSKAMAALVAEKRRDPLYGAF
jgi:hypothetical protein